MVCRKLWSLLTCFLLLALSAGTRAQTEDPAAILALAKQASGGAAWDAVQFLHLQLLTTAGGLTGTADEWDDVRTGRWKILTRRPPEARANGFDGVSVWTQAPGGYSYVLGDEDARQGAVNQAYQTCRAFWFPERFPATLASAGSVQEKGRSYDIVEITPQAGRPFRVWIDQATHLVDRFTEQQGEDVQITQFQDYRPVAAGIKLPFTVRTGDGAAQWDEVDTLQSATVNIPLAPNQFALPPVPPPDFQFKSGSSTTVPFHLNNDKILISIKLNGQGPFEAELDSGGNYIVQPASARRLRLTAQGAAQEGGGGESYVAAGKVLMDTVDIGGVRLSKQSYKVLSFSKKSPEWTLIGLQILQRFVVSLDFDRQTMTLTRPDQFAYHGTGAVIPFHFQDNQPEINGAVDGIAGEFTIDTGDNGSLLLIAPFVKRYDLVSRYKAVTPYGGTAVGGATHGLLTQASVFTFFGADGYPIAEVHHPSTRLSQQKGGFDADRYVSGNVGIGILKQFNVIFDYSRRQIILEKRSSRP